MPQQAWSKKRERQYEHIKENLEDRGTGEEKAEEIAARTVNKERARKGEAKTSSRLSRTDMSSGRRGGARPPTHRAKGGPQEEHHNQTKRVGGGGRARVRKEQRPRAPDRPTRGGKPQT